MDSVFSFMKTIKKFFRQIWNWIIVKFSGEEDDGYLLPPHMYDIYYHFKILEKDGKLEGLTLCKLYINHFDIEINDTEYYIRIEKEDNEIYTDLYYKEKVIYQDDFYHKEHKTYSSLENEIERAARDYIYVEMPDEFDIV